MPVAHAGLNGCREKENMSAVMCKKQHLKLVRAMATKNKIQQSKQAAK